MTRITQKIKGIVTAKGIGIFRGAARIADADIRGVFLSPDGSWGWPLRILILCAAFVIAALTVRYFVDDITRLLLSYYWGRPVSPAEYEAMIGGSQMLPAVVTAGLFGLVFGLGNWAIKNHDVKQAARARFRETNKQSYASAVHSLSEKGASDARVRNAHGLMGLAMLAHQGAIEKEKIDAITRVGHDLRGINLEKAALMGLDLKDVQLSDALLEDADLSRANLPRAKLMGANLNGAQLTSACLADADLSEVQCIGADLQDAVLTGARLQGADLSGANLRGADLRAARLAETNLFRAKLSKANLSGADLSGADLAGADFFAARLVGTDLKMSDVCGADLREADLGGVHAQGALYDESTKFPEGFDPEKHGLQSL